MRFLLLLTLLTLAICITTSTDASETSVDQSNVVIIFCDDLGYGDLGCFGHPTISTPNLDRMATEGQRWTNFYVAASVCTPSRSGLVTGRLPVRTGMCDDQRRVLFPDSSGGLQDSELTIAEVMKSAGYATACVGKWHLGHLPQYLPTAHGFDSYFGIPYSNDMDRLATAPKGRESFNIYDTTNFNVPLMRDLEIVERPADQETITTRYTDAAIDFIEANQNGPFFLYLAHNLPHVPLFVAPENLGASRRGLYGDVIEEIDQGVGRILDTLRESGLDEKTLVVFTSDNGPWLTFFQQGGSAGLLREGKGCTFEGGMREPTIFWQPGSIEPGVVMDMGATLDLLPTCAAIAGAELPDDLILDGYDISGTLYEGEPSPRDVVYYYRGTKIFAIRKGAYKAHFMTQGAYGGEPYTEHETPLLYNLEHDPSEKYDIAADHPDVVADLTQCADDFRASFTPAESQLAGRIGE
jgi:arylsulfatase A